MSSLTKKYTSILLTFGILDANRRLEECSGWLKIRASLYLFIYLFPLVIKCISELYNRNVGKFEDYITLLKLSFMHWKIFVGN